MDDAADKAAELANTAATAAQTGTGA
jgi:hypothetical protein